MLILRGEINKIVITVTEQTTISSPYYLFEFTSKSTKESVYCIAQPVTTTRCDTFEIEETDSPDAESGQVSLLPGEYRYTVYQQSSSTNLNPLLTTPSVFNPYVEVGACVVPGETSSDVIYDGSTKKFNQYNG